MCPTELPVRREQGWGWRLCCGAACATVLSPMLGLSPGVFAALARVCQPLCRGILAVPASPALGHEAWSCAWAEHHPRHALTAPTSHTAASQQCSIAKWAGRGWVWTWSLPVASLQLLIPAPKLPWTSLKWLLLMNPTAWSLGGSLTLHPNSKSPVFDGGSRSSPFPAGPTRTPAVVQPAISSSSHRMQDLCCCFRARLESHISGGCFSPCCERADFKLLGKSICVLCQGCTAHTPCPGLLQGGIASKAQAKGTDPNTAFPLLHLKQHLLLPNQGHLCFSPPGLDPQPWVSGGFQPSPCSQQDPDCRNLGQGTENGGNPPGAMS